MLRLGNPPSQKKGAELSPCKHSACCTCPAVCVSRERERERELHGAHNTHAHVCTVHTQYIQQKLEVGTVQEGRAEPKCLEKNCKDKCLWAALAH